jgi:membrane protein implicated in regulation of membrane protease activity
MPRPPERRWPLVLAGYVLFVALAGIASALIYYLVEAPRRPLVVRLTAALILSVVAIHLSKRIRARIEERAGPGRGVARGAAPRRNGPQ